MSNPVIIPDTNHIRTYSFKGDGGNDEKSSQLITHLRKIRNHSQTLRYALLDLLAHLFFSQLTRNDTTLSTTT
eukprot:UN07375